MNTAPAPVYIPTLEEGTFKLKHVGLKVAEIPGVVALMYDKLVKNQIVSVEHYVPVTTAAERKALTSLGDVIIAGERVIIDRSDPGYSAPDGTFKLFDTWIEIAHGATSVHARWWTPEGKIEGTVVHLNFITASHAKEFRAKVHTWLSQPTNIERLLKANQKVAARIAQQTKAVEFWPFDTALALSVLNRNLFNRELQWTSIENYVLAMQTGGWNEAESEIAISRDGVMMNGAHRAVSVVLSGATIDQGLGFHYRPESSDTFDSGHKRNLAGQHDINGREQTVTGVVRKGAIDRRGFPKGKVYAKTARAICLFETLTNTRWRKVYEEAIAREYAASFVWANGWLTKRDDRYDLSILDDNGVLLACLIIAHHHSPEAIDIALDRLLRNDGLAEGTPLHTINKFLTSEEKREDSKGNGNLGVGNKILACLRAHIDGAADFPYTQINDRVSSKKVRTQVQKATLEARKSFMAKRTIRGQLVYTFLPTYHPELTLTGEAEAEAAEE